METILNLLVRSSLVGSGLALLLLLFAWLLRKRIPSVWIHALLLVAVVRLLLVCQLPTSTISWETWLANPQGEQLTMHFTDVFEEPLTESSLSDDDQTAVPILVSETPGKQVWSWLSLFFYGWIAGVVAMVIAIVVSVIRYRRLLSDSAPPEKSHRILKLLDDAVNLAGFKYTPRLLFCNSVDTPAIGGLFRPVILFPKASLEYLEDGEVESILLHELGHLRRKDLWTNSLLLVVQVIHWFNPLAWYLCHRVRVASEWATDDWVIKKLGVERKSTYGSALLNLLDHREPSSFKSAMTVGVAESKTELKQRILAIASFRSKANRWIAAICLLALGLLTGVGLTQAPKEAKEAQVEKSRLGEAVTVTSDSFETFDKTLMFKGNVNIKSNGFELTGEKIEINCDSDDRGSFENWIATGAPLTISRETPQGFKEQAKARRISFDSKTSTIVIEDVVGLVQIRDGQSLKLPPASRIIWKADGSFEIARNVVPEKKVNSVPTNTDKVEITCESIKSRESNGRKVSFIYEGEVVCTYGGVEIKSDRMEMFLNDKGIGTKLVATGEVVQLEKPTEEKQRMLVKCRKVVFDLNLETIEASGGPANLKVGGQTMSLTSNESAILFSLKNGGYSISGLGLPKKPYIYAVPTNGNKTMGSSGVFRSVDTVKVSCEEEVTQSKGRKASLIFEGKVICEYRGVEIKGDRVEIFLNDKDIGTELVATGEVVQLEKPTEEKQRLIVKSRKVVFDLSLESIVASGGPPYLKFGDQILNAASSEAAIFIDPKGGYKVYDPPETGPSNLQLQPKEEMKLPRKPELRNVYPEK